MDTTTSMGTNTTRSTLAASVHCPAYSHTNKPPHLYRTPESARRRRIQTFENPALRDNSVNFERVQSSHQPGSRAEQHQKRISALILGYFIFSSASGGGKINEPIFTTTELTESNVCAPIRGVVYP